jgi:hypothetical protein
MVKYDLEVYADILPTIDYIYTFEELAMSIFTIKIRFNVIKWSPEDEPC